MDWAKTTVRWDEKHLSFGIWWLILEIWLTRCMTPAFIMVGSCHVPLLHIIHLPAVSRVHGFPRKLLPAAFVVQQFWLKPNWCEVTPRLLLYSYVPILWHVCHTSVARLVASCVDATSVFETKISTVCKNWAGPVKFVSGQMKLW